MTDFAALNDYKKRVTGVCDARSLVEAKRLFTPEGRTDSRRIIQLPPDRQHMTLNQLTAIYFPEYD